jgi:hypothetical protein
MASNFEPVGLFCTKRGLTGFGQKYSPFKLVLFNYLVKARARFSGSGLHPPKEDEKNKERGDSEEDKVAVILRSFNNYVPIIFVGKILPFGFTTKLFKTVVQQPGTK